MLWCCIKRSTKSIPTHKQYSMHSFSTPMAIYQYTIALINNTKVNVCSHPITCTRVYCVSVGKTVCVGVGIDVCVSAL